MNFKLPKCKKGVSPIIATLLLIVIAVAAAVVTYSFVMGFIGTSTNPSGQQGRLNLDSYVLYENSFSIYARNIGTKEVEVDAVYIQGQKAEIDESVKIPINTAQKIEGTPSEGQTITPGNSYTVRLVCTDGTILEFTAVATAAPEQNT